MTGTDNLSVIRDAENNNPFVEFAERYRHDPVGFVVNVLEVRPDPWQARIMQDVADGVRKISVRSCHGVGKTAVLSWIAVWACCVFPAAKVIQTAPSGPQLWDALFAETKMWFKRLPPALLDLFDIMSDRIEHKGAAESIFVSARTSRAEKPESLQGVHAEEGIVILMPDEASGIPEPVFEAAIGSMSGENCCTIMTSNPTRTSGTFFDSQTRLRGSWKTYKISHEDSTRVSKQFVAEVAEKYGEDSNQFRVRCLAEFPKADDDTLIALELVESATERDIELDPEVAPVWGVDISRFGDDKTALCERFGKVVPAPVDTWQKLDLMSTAGRIKNRYDEARVKPKFICVDVIGIGAGVVDRLREQGLPVIGVNVSESASLKDGYVNLRAELWDSAKAWLEAKDCRLPAEDQDLVGELSVPKYKFTSNGKLQLESKDDMKKRGIRSPNKADAFVMTFAVEAGGMSGQISSWGKPLKRNIKGIV